ncbi:MAG: hypothetical protein ACE5IP_08740 [Terriglobia bacterium]
MKKLIVGFLLLWTISVFAAELETIRLIHVKGTSETALKVRKDIRKGKHGTKGCIKLASPQKAHATLTVSETRKKGISIDGTEFGTNRRATAILDKDGEILWETFQKDKGLIGGRPEKRIIKALVKALGCKD